MHTLTHELSFKRKFNPMSLSNLKIYMQVSLSLVFKLTKLFNSLK